MKAKVITSSEILDELHRQINIIKQTGKYPQTIYISIDYIRILYTELTANNSLISHPLQASNRLLGLPFYNVVESDHINVI